VRNVKLAFAALLAVVSLGAAAGLAAEGPEPKGYDTSKTFDELTHAEKTAAKLASRKKKLLALRVCADPGNMPMSNAKREGYQNKIIETLARAMDTRVIYFWRPYLERGLTRETFANDECDVLLDLPADYEGVLTTNPIYRSTYVFATRESDDLLFETFDDPRLKRLRVGTFQHSAMRTVLAAHGVRDVEVHVISHDADLSPEKQPWRQVQEVVDGKLDVAAVWGPFAGYVKTVRGAPLRLQPLNLMEDETPLEFDLAIGMRKTDVVLKFKLDDALEAARDEIKRILADYGVPLVQCSKCVVTGDIPSHGSFFTDKREIARRIFLEGLPAERTQLDKNAASADQIVSADRLEAWLKEGADLDQELGNAVLASDRDRVEFLLGKGADIDAPNLQGYPPLHMAARQRDSDMIALLVSRGADVNGRDSDGWTALAHAAFRNHVPSIDVLARAGANLDAGPPGFTPLAIAIAEGKFFAARALIEAGASVEAPSGKDGLTPLMLVASQPQARKRAASVVQGPSPVDLAKMLIAKGADVNAATAKGVTALMVASAHNNPPLIGLLLQSGAKLDAKTPDGKTALDIAKANQNAAAVQQIELFARTGGRGEAADSETFLLDEVDVGQ
jgi:quinoprotein dehydrogenase-associated probable ABC transporter substrate-binding protein